MSQSLKKAYINYENESWWLRQWKNSHIAKRTADGFVTLLKYPIPFAHSSGDSVSETVSFYYESNEFEMFISLKLFYQSGQIILSEPLGKALKIEPTQRPYNKIYLLEFSDLKEMAEKIDGIWKQFFLKHKKN